MIMKTGIALAAFVLASGMFFSGTAEAAPPTKLTVWVPDFIGEKVYVDQLSYGTAPYSFSKTTIDVSSKNCHPNSVAILNTDLYVVCADDPYISNPGLDQILVYNTGTKAYEKTITGLGYDGVNYFTGGQLIAIVFDTHHNLWVSALTGDNGSGALFRVPNDGSADSLTSSTPYLDREVVDSPPSPAGMAIDIDGSFWIVGDGGTGNDYILNFPDSVFNQPNPGGGQYYLGSNALNPPTPSYCTTDASVGSVCPSPSNGQSTLSFNNPEGIAVFGGAVWVSNNGGNAPAATLIRLSKGKLNADGTHPAAVYGGTVGSPFSCPGGMFSLTVPGVAPALWVNDEGYGQGVHTDCGSSSTYQGDQIGRALKFQLNDLLAHQATPLPEQFKNWDQIGTGSPGFGGIFVQLQ